MSKKVLLIIAHNGFQPVEYSVPKKILQEAGITVVTASDAPGVAVSSISSEPAKVDLVLDEVKVGDYEGIFFIGGPGALEHLDNKKSYRIIRGIVGAPSPRPLWGAICISPRILAKAGVLKNKTAAGWDGDNELFGILESAGATYVREPVVVDGNLITASGPPAAEEFGKVILKELEK